MHNVKNELNSEKIYNKLNKYHKAYPILNYNIIHEEIMLATEKHMPIKIMKFNKYKHKHSTWITQGLLKSMKYRDSFYKQLKMSNSNSTNYEGILTNFKSFNSTLKKTISAAPKKVILSYALNVPKMTLEILGKSSMK